MAKNVTPAPTREPILGIEKFLSVTWIQWFSTLYDFLNMNKLGTYADNATATAAGLKPGNLYRTSTGQVMVVY